MPDTTITVGVNVENLEEVKELREELEKIRDLKKEIDKLGEDETPTFPHTDDIDIDPYPSPEPDNTRRPRFYVSGKNEEFMFDDDETIKATTEIDI